MAAVEHHRIARRQSGSGRHTAQDHLGRHQPDFATAR
jgi:hypothetical protein